MKLFVVLIAIFSVAKFSDCCKCNKDFVHYQTKLCNTNTTIIAMVREKYLINENGKAYFVRLGVDQVLQRQIQSEYDNSIRQTEIEAHYTEVDCNEDLVVNRTYFISGKIGLKSQTLLLDSCSLIRPIAELYLNQEEYHGIAGNYKRGCQCNIRECEYCLNTNNHECTYHPSLRNVYFKYTCLPLLRNNKCVWSQNGLLLNEQSRLHRNQYVTSASAATEPDNFPKKMSLNPYHHHVYNHEIYDSSNNLLFSTKRRVEHKYSSLFHIEEKETDFMDDDTRI